jgi:hypothetical protein
MRWNAVIFVWIAATQQRGTWCDRLLAARPTSCEKVTPGAAAPGAVGQQSHLKMPAISIYDKNMVNMITDDPPQIDNPLI